MIKVFGAPIEPADAKLGPGETPGARASVDMCEIALEVEAP